MGSGKTLEEKVSEWNELSKRPGRFVVGEFLLKEPRAGAALLKMFGTVIVLRAGFSRMTLALECEGWSPCFDMIGDPSWECPAYVPEFLKAWDGGVEFKGWRRGTICAVSTKGNMDTRTGKFYEGTPVEIEKQFKVPAARLVPVGNLPAATCPICLGRGYLKRGLFSRRFKPCSCTNPA